MFGAAFEGARGRTLRDHEADGEPARQSLMTWFLGVFIGMVVLNSLGALSPLAQWATSDFSRACLVVAIAALGMKISFNELARLGWRRWR
jgi:uncharacterized membrane protein YadS